jgi:FlaA1/EpsC-like NDP-sugar epimerase
VNSSVLLQLVSQLHSIMKVLITGVTGGIGRCALDQCLKHKQITSIVALVRRELPLDFISATDANREKFDSIVVKDFNSWPIEVLERINDADAMIW